VERPVSPLFFFKNTVTKNHQWLRCTKVFDNAEGDNEAGIIRGWSNQERQFQNTPGPLLAGLVRAEIVTAATETSQNPSFGAGAYKGWITARGTTAVVELLESDGEAREVARGEDCGMWCMLMFWVQTNSLKKTVSINLLSVD
jgi:hypothetical protein